jgi:hypothetical protein
MSSGGSDSWYSISFISYEKPSRREGFFRAMTFLAHAMARRFRARPHWGKLCPLEAKDLIPLYDRFTEFQHICKEFDPEGYFQNPWTREILMERNGERGA